MCITRFESINQVEDELVPAVTEEFKQCKEALDLIGPVVPGAIFLFPRAELLNTSHLVAWFPSLEEFNELLDMSPSVLLYDDKLYLDHCAKILIHNGNNNPMNNNSTTSETDKNIPQVGKLLPSPKTSPVKVITGETMVLPLVDGNQPIRSEESNEDNDKK